MAHSVQAFGCSTEPQDSTIVAEWTPAAFLVIQIQLNLSHHEILLHPAACLVPKSAFCLKIFNLHQSHNRGNVSFGRLENWRAPLEFFFGQTSTVYCPMRTFERCPPDGYY